MAANAQPRPESPAAADLAAAWKNFRHYDGGQTQKYGLGLKLGEVCCAARDRYWSQGRKGKGAGFLLLLQRVHIPRNTAYRWMRQYAKCDVTPEQWIARANAPLPVDEAKRERNRQAAREWQRRYKAKVKEAELILAQRGEKPGPKPDMTTGAQVDELYKQGVKWPNIKEQMDAATRVHRTEGAWRMLRMRYLELKERTN